MRNSTALKTNLTITFHYWVDLSKDEYLSMKINDIEICIFRTRCIRIIESIFNHQFVEDEVIELVADTFKVDKRDLYINGSYVVDFDYTRMWLINEAFAPVSGYSISVTRAKLSRAYSWSQGWHIQNMSSRIEEIENVKPKDLGNTLSELKSKYSAQVEQNTIFSFEIIEYRGKEFNRAYKDESVGYEPDNFDEDIRKEIFR